MSATTGWGDGAAEAAGLERGCPLIVLDTNIVLDLLLFTDPATPPLRAALEDGVCQWITTPVMREELARVLQYAHLQPRLAYYGLQAQDVLGGLDRGARLVEPAPRAPMICKDADDQKFIDLAYAHRAALLSKDHAVLRLRKRLLVCGVPVAAQFSALSTLPSA